MAPDIDATDRYGGYRVVQALGTASLTEQESRHQMLARTGVGQLDMFMPGMEGTQVLEGLRARGIESRVVFLSGMLDRDVVYGAIAAGASAYLSKNSTPDEICDVIEAVARGETVIPPEIQAG